LYEVTVGRRPFQGEGALSTLYQLLEQTVASPTEIVPGYPAPLAAIVLKALAKDANERYQTAEDLRVALEAWIASSGSTVSERDIAALMRKTLGSEIDDKQKRINEASAKLKDQTTDAGNSQSGDHSVPAPASGSPARRREGAITEDRGVATGSIREKSSWWLPIAAALGVLGVVIVLARGSFGTEAPQVVQPANAANAPAPASPNEPAQRPAQQPETTPVNVPAQQAEAQQVKITVRTIPAHASIRIDGGEPIETPYSIQVAASPELREITASSANYTSVTRQVSFDQSREIVIELERQQQGAQRPAPSHRGGRAPAAAGNPTSAAPDPELPLVSPREPGTPGTGRRPRSLDADNPFSG
jgi:serine/threonine-protein kinase